MKKTVMINRRILLKQNKLLVVGYKFGVPTLHQQPEVLLLLHLPPGHLSHQCHLIHFYSPPPGYRPCPASFSTNLGKEGDSDPSFFSF